MYFFWKDYQFTPDLQKIIREPRFAASVVTSLTIIGIVLYLLNVFFRDRIRVLKHKQLITQMIFSRGLYESKSVQVNKSFGSGAKSVDKITYFPKIYYRIKEGYLYLRFPTDGKKHQENFLSLGQTLENMLFCDLVEVEQEEGYVIYKLLFDVAVNRIGIDEVKPIDGQIKLMKNLTWDYEGLPHMLVSGGTGGGKTYYLLTLINAFCEIGEVSICDPKEADLADLEAILPGQVYSQKNGIKMCVNNFRKDMEERKRTWKSLPNYRSGLNYSALGLPARILVFDEYVAYLSAVDRTTQAEVIDDLLQIILMGRQLGFFLVLACQRPDAKFMPDGMRDQFGLRIALGKMSSLGYTMMFGETDKAFKNKKVKGRGYADTGGNMIMEFYSPLVPKGYDLQEEIGKQLAAKRTSADDSPLATAKSERSGE